ncbi:MAG: hypothetical protein J0H73_17300 [Salana multivorans]|uniref:hypothetical protein n=1 Tax=Salana multivorans TaxID=120377 RepID=UPI000968E3EB|nr:hypothetical protein [Salana multivorans]MBN8884051.1 hypothetical protein [Salana multivorans]OJX98439.1 MAG: hypothetical protein BGO96_04570 [Micrococcales bacterium 73-15]
MTTSHTVTCEDCGWTGTGYTSPAMASYQMRRHSCDKQRHRDAVEQRKADRRAAIDANPPAPCHHTTPHQHGTHTCYVLDRCRCRACTDATAAYTRDLNRRNAYGRSNLTPAQPVRDHVAALRAAGMGLKTIATAAQISTGTLTKIVYGAPRPDGTRRPPAARTTKTTAAKILALNPTIKPGAHVDATGSRRRLQALTAIGYSAHQLATRAGLDRQIIDALLLGKRRQVLAATAATIRSLYTGLEHTPATWATPGQRGSVNRAVARAKRAGWLVPAWWDPDTIDDPEHTPTPRPRTGLPKGEAVRLNTISRLDDWIHLVQGGDSPDRAATRCGWTDLANLRTAANRTHHHAALTLLDTIATQRTEERAARQMSQRGQHAA